MHEKKPDKAVKLLIQLIKSNPARPEPYLLLWQYYYYKEKNYDSAENLAKEAFALVKTSQYTIIFAVNYAKTVFRMKKYRLCFEILQKQYLENPLNSVFLYQYGRMCVKSEDPLFIVSAIGALQECLRISRSDRYGLIYYWLAKAYLISRMYIEGYYTMKKALNLLGSSEINKKLEIKKYLREYNSLITNLEFVESCLNSETVDQVNRCLDLAAQIKNFQKVAGEIILCKIFWTIDQKAEAVSRLKLIASESVSNLNAYFVLIEYTSDLAEQKKIAKNLIKKCKSQIPTPVKIQAYVLYSKILCKCGNPNKAINVLKVIAKIYPPFPLADLPYLNYLRLANGYSELMLASSKAMDESPEYEFFTSSFSRQKFLSDPDEKATGALNESFSDKKIIAPVRGFSRKGTKFACVVKKSPGLRKFHSLSIQVETDRDSIGDLAKIINIMKFLKNYNGEAAFPEFSLSSDIKFLYLIGKIA